MIHNGKKKKITLVKIKNLVKTKKERNEKVNRTEKGKQLKNLLLTQCEMNEIVNFL